MKYVVRTGVGADAGTVRALVDDLSAWPTWTSTFETVDTTGMLKARTETVRRNGTAP